MDIRKKRANLQFSWIKRLCDDPFHEWKIIPLHLISKLLAGPLFSILTFPSKRINQIISIFGQGNPFKLGKNFV